jgi:hypothetical protein
MKRTVKISVELDFEVGKTYMTKFATKELFTVYEIKRDVKGNIVGFIGVYQNCKHLGNCPIAFDRLIPEKGVIEITEMEESIRILKQKFPLAEVFESCDVDFVCVRHTIGQSRFGKNDKGEEVIIPIYNTEKFHIDSVKLKYAQR